MNWAVWVGGVDDTYTTEQEARQAAADWRRKGYTDVIVERVSQWEPDHPAVIAWRQQGDICQHCHRDIVNRGGQWIDPEATGDDSMWREVCDGHDSWPADHEPRPRTLAERTYAVRERRGLGHPTGAGRRFRLWCGFLSVFLSAGLVEEAPGAAVIGLLIGAACVLPEMIGGNR